MSESPNDIVGHKTFSDGPMSFRHEPLTRAEADVLWAAAEAAEAKRAADMPTEQDAIDMLFQAQQRLKELGWKEGMYCPKDGSAFKTIEAGSTGIFDCTCHGEWPNCDWTSYDEHDAYPSSHPPLMFKLLPEAQKAHDEKMAALRAKFAEQEADISSIP